MNISRLKQDDLGQVMDLFCECFKDDHYYRNLFENEDTRITLMREKFKSSIEYCIEKGYSIGVADEQENLHAEPLFYDIFSASFGKELL